MSDDDEDCDVDEDEDDEEGEVDITPPIVQLSTRGRVSHSKKDRRRRRPRGGGRVRLNQFRPSVEQEIDDDLPVQEGSRPHLRIIKFSPYVTANPYTPYISLTFSYPPFADSDSDSAPEPEIPTTALSIDPPIEGHWSWYTSSILRFRPHPSPESERGKFVVGTSYECTLRNFHGIRYFALRFTVKPLSIECIIPSSFVDPRPERVKSCLFMVRFNAPVPGNIVMMRSEDGGPGLRLCEYDGGGGGGGGGGGEVEVPLRIVESRKEVEDIVRRDEMFIEQRKACGDYRMFSASVAEGMDMYFDRTVWLLPSEKNWAGNEEEIAGRRQFVFRLASGDEKRTFTFGPLKCTGRQPSASRQIDSSNTKSFNFHFSNPVMGLERNPEMRVVVDPPLTERAYRTDTVYEDGGEREVLKELPFLEVRSSLLLVSGALIGGQSYTVRVSGVRDCFGQLCEDEIVEEFEIMLLPRQMRSHYSNTGFCCIDSSSESPNYFSMNVLNITHCRVKVFRVNPLNRWNWKPHSSVEGRDYAELVFDEEVPTNATGDKWTTFNFLLREDFLQSPELKLGHVVVECQPSQFLTERCADRGYVRVWFQVTQYAPSVLKFPGDLTYAFVTTFDGKFVDLPVRFSLGGHTEIPSEKVENDRYLYRLRTDQYVSNFAAQISVGEVEHLVLLQKEVIPPTAKLWDRDRNLCYKFYVIDDRKTYRPGTEVHVKGMIRQLVVEEGATNYKVILPKLDLGSSYSLTDVRGRALVNGEFHLNELGAFDLVLELPEADGMTLGECTLQLRYHSTGHAHTFTVQEFRVPKFVVSVDVDPKGGVLPSDGISLKTVAKYVEGGFVQGGRVNLKVRSESAPSGLLPGYSFMLYRKPDKYEEIDFGDPCPDYFDDYGLSGGIGKPDSFSWKTIEGETNEFGTFRFGTNAKDVLKEMFLTIPKKKLADEFKMSPLPQRLIVNSSVTDADQTTFAASTALMIHPFECYVGVLCRKNTLEPGEEIPVKCIVTDWQGFVRSGVNVECCIKSVLALETVHRIAFESREDPVDLSEFGESIRLETPGKYEIFFRVGDSMDRSHVCSTEISITGKGEGQLDTIEKRIARLTPNADSYLCGDVAKILVQVPFDEGFEVSGALFAGCARVGLASTFQVEAEAKNLAILDVPICDGSGPNVDVRVVLFGRCFSAKFNRHLPSYAEGSCRLPVSFGEKKLCVEVIPTDKELVPRNEVTVVIADKAHLALKGYKLSNPIDLFYPTNAGVSGTFYDLRSGLSMKKVEEQSAGGRRSKSLMSHMDFGSDDDECNFGSPAIVVPTAPPPVFRMNFAPLALFAPSLCLDQNGEVVIPFSLPDSLTTWRISAIVTKKSDCFGLGQAEVVTSLPFSIKPTLPRFLNYKDVAELASLVTNRTKSSLAVVVSFFVAGSLDAVGDASKEILIPPGANVKVCFGVKASRIGDCRVRLMVTAKDDGASDGVEQALRVISPPASDVVADHGEVEDEDGSVIVFSTNPRKYSRLKVGVIMPSCRSFVGPE